MAIGVRDITNLEELLEVQDDDKIIIIQNGEAKLVSKANAKFGGGTVTLFYPDPNGEPDDTRLVDVNGDPISAQAAYDAAMSGLVYIIADNFEGSTIVLVPSSFGVKKSNGEIVTVSFMVNFGGREAQVYAGVKPEGGKA